MWRKRTGRLKMRRRKEKKKKNKWGWSKKIRREISCTMYTCKEKAVQCTLPQRMVQMVSWEIQKFLNCYLLPFTKPEKSLLLFPFPTRQKISVNLKKITNKKMLASQSKQQRSFTWEKEKKGREPKVENFEIKVSFFLFLFSCLLFFCFVFFVVCVVFDVVVGW